MTTVSLKDLALEDYAEIVGREEIDEIFALGEKLTGRSVLHVNSTSYGGGVAEILRRLVPLMRDAGLRTEWKVIQGDAKFFGVTKAFHNALQGKDMTLTDDMKQVYLQRNELNANALDFDYDYVVVHDTQPSAMIDYRDSARAKWVWRCHIDVSQPNMRFWKFLEPFLMKYDASIFSLDKYVRSPLKGRNVAIISPSIDPLSDKNKPLSMDVILNTLRRYDVKSDRPIISQVARFDPWKDPLGVIDVYRMIRKRMGEVQLLLIASMALDDPEGWVYYERTARHAGEDYDIHLLTDLVGVGDLEVNAFQRASHVGMLKSIREGFGLSVSETLWKEVPVIGGNVGGIPLQVIDGETGFLVNNPEEAVEKTLHLLEHREAASELGRKGKQHVKENFLITRHLKEYLKLFLSLN